MSKTYTLRNNNTEQLLTNRKKNNCPINNQVNYIFIYLELILN